MSAPPLRESEESLRRLRFTDTNTEAAFRQHYAVRFVEAQRAAVWVVFLAFMALRLGLLLRGFLGPNSLIGTIGGGTALAALVYCTHRRELWRHVQSVAAIAVIMAGASVVPFWLPFVRDAIAPARANSSLNAVALYLLILLLFTYTLSRLRFVYATLVGWTLSLFFLVYVVGLRDLVANDPVLSLPTTAVSTPAPQSASKRPQRGRTREPRLQRTREERRAAVVVAAATPGISIDILWRLAVVIISANGMGMVAAYWSERYGRRDYLLTQLLDAERAKSEDLLLNILPGPVAARLKDSPETVVDSFADVSVLFADLVDFTPLAARLSPEAVVGLLNDIFSAFDALAEKHGLEKIKTIGDAYMVVAGLPEPRQDHAQVMIEMARDMRTAVAKLAQERSLPLAIRIGINSGPVVAGVIGTKKFIYDLWGDTVNTASRMESHGEPGQIQVTPDTYDRLKEQYTFEERGPMVIKGRGEMCTYVLKT
jgi:class 3 adenylate cyclase